MLAAIRGFFIVILFGFFSVTSAQLPPNVLADKYLIQAEQLLEKKEYDAALSLLDKIIALQKEHGFALRDEFHFKHAKIAYAAGLIPTAIDAVSAYLSTGSEGEFYKEALALLIEAEEEMQEVEITPDKTCAGKPEGGSCWMALADRPECYVWNPNPHYTVTWSGECAGDVAQGEGTLTWAVADADSSRVTGTSTGRLRNGKMHGKWVTSYSEIHYMKGIQHGPYILRGASFGKRMFQGWKGEYVHGKREGVWLSFHDDGYA